MQYWLIGCGDGWNGIATGSGLKVRCSCYVLSFKQLIIGVKCWFCFAFEKNCHCCLCFGNDHAFVIRGLRLMEDSDEMDCQVSSTAEYSDTLFNWCALYTF